MLEPRPILSWDVSFMELALSFAKRSKDPSTQVGCVIVGQPPGYEIKSMGYNGIPRGLSDKDPTLYQRPGKYRIVEHAERNAIYNAARFGAALIGCRIYVTHHPCTDCARAIIQAGIVEVFVPRRELNVLPDRWHGDFMLAEKMLREAEVQLLAVDIIE